LREEFTDQTLLFFIVDTHEHFRTQILNCLCPIERQTRVLLATAEVARLATSLKDRFDLFGKVHFGRGLMGTPSTANNCEVTFRETAASVRGLI
jgi:hypothetical protein